MTFFGGKCVFMPRGLPGEGVGVRAGVKGVCTGVINVDPLCMVLLGGSMALIGAGKGKLKSIKCLLLDSAVWGLCAM